MELEKFQGIITKYNVDSNGSSISVTKTEEQQIHPLKFNITTGIIDESEGFTVLNKEMYPVRNYEDIQNANQYWVDYAGGRVYFHKSLKGTAIRYKYGDKGQELISATRIFTKVDDEGNVVEVLSDLVEQTKEYIAILGTFGEATIVINKLDADIKKGNTLHNNLTSDIAIATPLHTQLDANIKEATTWKDQLNQDVTDGKVLQPKLQTNVSDAKTLQPLLNNDVTVGTPLQKSLHSDIAEANKFKDQLKQDVADGKILQPLLNSDVKEAKDIQLILEDNILTAIPLQEQLNKDIQDAIAFKDSLNEDVAEGKVLQPLLNNNITEGRVLQEQLSQSIEEALDDITIIESTGNDVINIIASEWIYNAESKMYEKEVMHNCNCENMHITAMNSNTKDVLFLPWKIVDLNSILVKSDIVEDITLILSARYYRPFISSEVEEKEVMDAREGQTTLLDNMMRKINYEDFTSDSIN